MSFLLLQHLPEAHDFGVVGVNLQCLLHVLFTQFCLSIVKKDASSPRKRKEMRAFTLWACSSPAAEEASSRSRMEAAEDKERKCLTREVPELQADGLQGDGIQGGGLLIPGCGTHGFQSRTLPTLGRHCASNALGSCKCPA